MDSTSQRSEGLLVRPGMAQSPAQPPPHFQQQQQLQQQQHQLQQQQQIQQQHLPLQMPRIPPFAFQPHAWIYRDPSGLIQGPFTAQQMQDWYTEGFFPPELPIKHVEDPSFQPLNLLVNRFGPNVPFLAELDDSHSAARLLYERRVTAMLLQQQQQERQLRFQQQQQQVGSPMGMQSHPRVTSLEMQMQAMQQQQMQHQRMNSREFALQQQQQQPGAWGESPGAWNQAAQQPQQVRHDAAAAHDQQQAAFEKQQILERQQQQMMQEQQQQQMLLKQQQEVQQRTALEHQVQSMSLGPASVPQQKSPQRTSAPQEPKKPEAKPKAHLPAPVETQTVPAVVDEPAWKSPVSPAPNKHSLKDIQEREAKVQAQKDIVQKKQSEAAILAQAAQIRENELTKQASIPADGPVWGGAVSAAVKSSSAAPPPIARTMSDIMREEESRRKSGNTTSPLAAGAGSPGSARRYADLVNSPGSAASLVFRLPASASNNVKTVVASKEPIVPASGWSTVGKGGQVIPPPAQPKYALNIIFWHLFNS